MPWDNLVGEKRRPQQQRVSLLAEKKKVELSSSPMEVLFHACTHAGFCACVRVFLFWFFLSKSVSSCPCCPGEGGRNVQTRDGLISFLSKRGQDMERRLGEFRARESLG